MLIRLSAALLLSLLLSAPSHALLLRRVIEHRAISQTVEAASCKADAARLCPGVPDDNMMQCLKPYKNQVSLPCAKDLRKLERMGQ